MVLLKRRNIFELCAMKQWKRWLATVRGAKRMRAGGSPLLVAGRLPTDGYDAADSTFLAKIFFVIYTTAFGGRFFFRTLTPGRLANLGL